MLRIQVSNRRESQQFEHASGPIEFGRGPKAGAVSRCVIQDLSVSRNHMRAEEVADGRLRVENLSEKNSIRLADDSIVYPLEKREVELPTRLLLGETLIHLASAGTSAAGEGDHSDSFQTLKQPARARRDAGAVPTLHTLGDAPTVDTLAEWFETVLFVQRAAAGSPEFYKQTAQALVDLVGLDKGLVLLREGETWQVAGRAGGRDRDLGREFSMEVLRRVVAEGRTFYESSPLESAMDASLSASLMGVEAVVASPILDSRDNVVGALYGSRSTYSQARRLSIGPLEARVVQVLASAVAAGMARQEQEAEATRRRVQFEQFFSSSLARELERDPGLLVGQQREVTVLFSDIRGFSRLAERLGPSDACRLIGDVMERLTARVSQFDGVVVDYYGDGLLAMWNAPRAQEGHAALACRAALAMLADLPGLSAAWQGKVGEALGLGIGVNTGVALVGNTGSSQKFKYGPLGLAVNLAQRVEGATRQLGIPALMTGTTRALLGDAFAVRRLCQVRVLGISEPQHLYELHAEQAGEEWRRFRDSYEAALGRFEDGQWQDSCRALYPLLASQAGSYDVPCLNLLTMAIDCIKTPPQAFDPALSLMSK